MRRADARSLAIIQPEFMIELRKIVEIGPEYARTGERSVAALEDAVRLVESKGPLDVQELQRIIESIPGCVAAWRKWSEDKRWTPAWAFDYENGVYTIALLGGERGEGGTAAPVPLTFSEENRACAEYIVREIDDFARVLASRSNKATECAAE